MPWCGGGTGRASQALEAPPSMPSLLAREGTDSATMETITVRRGTDGRTGAGDLMRQRARRSDARGTDPGYEGVTFDAGRRWVSR
jgi:hypothetical protein